MPSYNKSFFDFVMELNLHKQKSPQKTSVFKGLYCQNFHLTEALLVPLTLPKLCVISSYCVFIKLDYSVNIIEVKDISQL